MKETKRLQFISNKSIDDLNQLWKNCFDGELNDNFMHAHIPPQYRVPNKNRLTQFLRSDGTWLIKTKINEDIIGFALHGNFLPGLPNNIGFNIGRDYARNGYAKETLSELLEYIKNTGLTETFGHCLDSNVGSIKTMEACGFDNLGKTGQQFNGKHYLKFRKQL